MSTNQLDVLTNQLQHYWTKYRIWSKETAQLHGERGALTVEHVLWAVGVIAIVAIVVGAITAFVTAQAARIA